VQYIARALTVDRDTVRVAGFTGKDYSGLEGYVGFAVRAATDQDRISGAGRVYARLYSWSVTRSIGQDCPRLTKYWSNKQYGTEHQEN
jgi:hypothetical protein